MVLRPAIFFELFPLSATGSRSFPEGFWSEKKPPDDPLFRAKQFERLSLRGLVPLNGKTVHVDFGLKNHGI